MQDEEQVSKQSLGDGIGLPMNGRRLLQDNAGSLRYGHASWLPKLFPATRMVL